MLAISRAVLPPPASGTTAQGGTTAPRRAVLPLCPAVLPLSGSTVGYGGTTVTPTEHTHPTDLLCSPLLGFCMLFLLCFVVAFWVGQVMDLVDI